MNTPHSESDSVERRRRNTGYTRCVSLQRLFLRTDPASSATRPVSTKEVIGILLLLFIVLVAAQQTMILSGFRKTPGTGDSNLVNYLLEHDWRWLTRQAHHTQLFSPPVFYSQSGTMAYSDLHLGSLPFYAIWRAVGMSPATAFQCWILTISAVNFLAMYLLLRSCLRCSVGASAIASVLFAFGSPRMVQIGHPQLLPAYFVVGTVAGLWMLFDEVQQPLSGKRVWLGMLLATFSAVAQFYTGFYYFWFMIFCAVPALIYSLAVPSFRKPLLCLLQKSWQPVLALIAIGALLLLPGVLPYYAALKQVGGRSYSEVAWYLPGPFTWLAEGPEHAIYGGLNRRMLSMAPDYRGPEVYSALRGFGRDYHGPEEYVGIGFLTAALVTVGFARFRRRPVVALSIVVTAVVITTTLSWHGLSLWRYIYATFPGAQAIRIASRFGVFLLLPAAIGLALAIDWLASRISAVAALVCLLAVFAEQAGSFNSDTYFYYKDQFEAATSSVEQALGGDCQSFLFSWTAGTMSPMWVHLAGMWAGLASGAPTLNGFSGQVPPGWPLGDVTIADRFDRLRLFEGIRTWVLKNPSKIQNICWVTPGASTSPEHQRQELYLSFGRIGLRPAVTSQAQTDRILRQDLQPGAFAIRRAYLALLGRLPREPELSSAPAEVVVRNIVASSEFRRREGFAFVAYRMLFQHDPPFLIWLYAAEDLAARRKSAEQLVEEWKGSEECRADNQCTSVAAGTLVTKALGDLPNDESEHASHVLLYYCLLGRAPGVSEFDDGPAWIRSALAQQAPVKFTE